MDLAHPEDCTEWTIWKTHWLLMSTSAYSKTKSEKQNPVVSSNIIHKVLCFVLPPQKNQKESLILRTIWTRWWEKIRAIPEKRTRIWNACETDRVGRQKNPQPPSSASSSSSEYSPCPNSSAEPSSRRKRPAIVEKLSRSKSRATASEWGGVGNLRRQNRSGFMLFLFVEG